ncbi:preprotein translocase subunit SecD, partial [Halolamina salifodinae]
MADEESTWDRIKANWRVVLLVVILLASTFALFSPTPASGGSAASTAGNNTTADSGLTNIEYGLELSGGTRIQAPLVGVHASGVEIPNDTSTSAVRSTVAANIENATASDVRVRYAGEYGDTIQQTTIVEVTAGNVTAAELDAALSEAGYPADGAVDRVSDVTQRTAVSILRQKVNQAGLSGGSVRTVGGDVVVVEVPNANQSEVRDLVESRGQVLIQAYHQNENGTYVRTTVMDSDDLRQVGNAQQTQGGQGAEVGVVVA